MRDLDYSTLPRQLHGAMRRYIEDGVPPGGFLIAVVSNDLSGAMGRADEDNRRDLYHTVLWLYNEAPGECWGSPEKFRKWIMASRNKVADVG